MNRPADVHRSPQPGELAAAVAGDQEAFRQLTDRYARELHVHCYRMLGSLQDAEDALQDTLLRAWRHLPAFEARSSFRAWLYRIATNVCLTRVAHHRREPLALPTALAEAVASSREPGIHLSPYPDALLDELEATTGNPVTEYDLRESVQLAFLAAIQLLPPRQRAVLILRDVLNFSAAEVAELLGSTTATVNSALQRARATLEHQRRQGWLHTGRRVAADAVERSLVRRYVEAWNAVDIDQLAALLTSDVVLTMPPLPLRYVGRGSVAEFFATVPAGGALDQFQLLPTRANRQPALAVYRFDPTDGTYRAWGLFVLTLDVDAVAEMTVFIDPALPPVFGLPAGFAHAAPPSAGKQSRALQKGARS